MSISDFSQTWMALPVEERRSIRRAVARGEQVADEDRAAIAVQLARRWQSQIRWAPPFLLVIDFLIWTAAYWWLAGSLGEAIIRTLKEPAFWATWLVTAIPIPFIYWYRYRMAEKANRN